MNNISTLLITLLLCCIDNTDMCCVVSKPYSMNIIWLIFIAVVVVGCQLPVETGIVMEANSDISHLVISDNQ